METEEHTRRVISPETRIGHVHLKVANIERSLWFYRDMLGFEFLGAGDAFLLIQVFRPIWWW